MPRDLAFESENETIDGLAPLSREAPLKSPDVDSEIAASLNIPLHRSPAPLEMGDELMDSPKDMLRQNMLSEDRRNELHPFVQTLNPSHVESCVVVENSSFPENERCSREKFQYRLATCGELSLGVFTCASTSPPTPLAEEPGEHHNPILDNTPTAAVAREITASGPPRKEILIGHIVGTMSANQTIKDNDMEIPSSWFTSPSNPNSFLVLSDPNTKADSGADAPSTPPKPTEADDSSPIKGNNSSGRTICIHSLAVLPQYQGRGLGKMLMKSYMSRMEGAGIADRIALLAHNELVGFYESLGFRKQGDSEATFGGGHWVDMVYKFPKPTEPPLTTLVGRAP